MQKIPEHWVLMLDNDNREIVQKWRKTLNRRWDIDIITNLSMIYVRESGVIGAELNMIYGDPRITTEQFIEQVLNQTNISIPQDFNYLESFLNKLEIK